MLEQQVNSIEDTSVKLRSKKKRSSESMMSKILSSFSKEEQVAFSTILEGQEPSQEIILGPIAQALKEALDQRALEAAQQTPEASRESEILRSSSSSIDSDGWGDSEFEDYDSEQEPELRENSQQDAELQQLSSRLSQLISPKQIETMYRASVQINRASAFTKRERMGVASMLEALKEVKQESESESETISLSKDHQALERKVEEFKTRDKKEGLRTHIFADLDAHQKIDDFIDEAISPKKLKKDKNAPDVLKKLKKDEIVKKINEGNDPEVNRWVKDLTDKAIYEEKAFKPETVQGIKDIEQSLREVTSSIGIVDASPIEIHLVTSSKFPNVLIDVLEKQTSKQGVKLASVKREENKSLTNLLKTAEVVKVHSEDQQSFCVFLGNHDLYKGESSLGDNLQKLSGGAHKITPVFLEQKGNLSEELVGHVKESLFEVLQQTLPPPRASMLVGLDKSRRPGLEGNQMPPPPMEDTGARPKKQPPTPPKRNPETKLSSSSPDASPINKGKKDHLVKELTGKLQESNLGLKSKPKLEGLTVASNTRSEAAKLRDKSPEKGAKNLVRRNPAIKR